MPTNTPLQLISIEPPGPVSASVIWLHGLGADGHDFEPIIPELGLAENHGVRFIFPHAPIRPITINGGMEMRAWYDIADQGLDRKTDEAGIRESATAIAVLLDGQLREGIESTRMVLAGFSQGGAIALHLGLRYPHRLAGILALSTYLPLGETVAAESAAMQRNLPIFVGHGKQDPMVPEALGSRSAQTLTDAGYEVEYKTYAMQHSVSPEEIRDVSTWLQARL
ncbi:MAG: phospholipase/carboxylesterase [Gammaproteobacteria bacterium]|jgi:phospholipase/carboxylesterase